MEKINNKEGIPLAHYAAVFASLSPDEISARTNILFDADRHIFTFRLMGTLYEVSHPEGVFSPNNIKPKEQILALRYLTGGRYKKTNGEYLSYSQMPWGNVYAAQFERRVLKRAAFSFASNSAALTEFQNNALAVGERVCVGDAAFCFEFIEGFFITLIVYMADEDFPPSAQMLFSENCHAAFSAEDLAVAGEIVIERCLRHPIL